MPDALVIKTLTPAVLLDMAKVANAISFIESSSNNGEQWIEESLKKASEKVLIGEFIDKYFNSDGDFFRAVATFLKSADLLPEVPDEPEPEPKAQSEPEELDTLDTEMRNW